MLELTPRSRGGPHDNRNHVAPTTGNHEPAHYNQHSSLVQDTSTMVHTPPTDFSRNSGRYLSPRQEEPFTFFSYERTDVTKTPAKSVRRTPAKSVRRGSKKQCVVIDTDSSARIRGPDWTEIEDSFLLTKKLEFSKKRGESWSRRASEFLKSVGLDRTYVQCRQRWDTLLKHHINRDQSRIDEGYVPAGFHSRELYQLMRLIIEDQGEQRYRRQNTQSSGQSMGTLAQFSAICTDPNEFTTANGPSLPPHGPTLLSNDAYASAQRFQQTTEHLQKRRLQPPPAFNKNWGLYHMMQTITDVHQKQQSPENDTCSSGQTVDASAPLSSLHNKAPECSAGPSDTSGLCPLDREVDVSAKPFGHGLQPSGIFATEHETQVPRVSSHDPHMVEMIRRVVLPAIQEMEENMKSSQNAWMAAISARLELYWQEVKTIKETLMVGENWGGSQTKVVADVVASTGEENAYLSNQDASRNSTFWEDFLTEDVRIGKFTT